MLPECIDRWIRILALPSSFKRFFGLPGVYGGKMHWYDFIAFRRLWCEVREYALASGT
jgi:hypothetical protein